MHCSADTVAVLWLRRPLVTSQCGTKCCSSTLKVAAMAITTTATAAIQTEAVVASKGMTASTSTLSLTSRQLQDWQTDHQQEPATLLSAGLSPASAAER